MIKEDGLMKNNAKPRAKFYVDKTGALVHAAVIFMALSAAFRLVGCWGLWTDQFFAAAQIALPLICNLLFILCLLLFGGRAFWTTAIPVVLGVVFFIIKSVSFESWVHTVLCILLYILVAVLYTATAFGVIRTKWLLVPLFGLPLIYHLAVEDAAALRDTVHPVTFSAGMQEISVLCIILALLLTALAMKKRADIEDVELPKIKDPVVIVPQKQTTGAPEAAPQDEPAAQDAQGTQEAQLPATPEPAAEDGADKKLCSPEGEASDAKPE